MFEQFPRDTPEEVAKLKQMPLMELLKYSAKKSIKRNFDKSRNQRIIFVITFGILNTFSSLFYFSSQYRHDKHAFIIIIVINSIVSLVFSLWLIRRWYGPYK